ncbi:MAG: hypothetical protein IJQ12_04385 [Lachnospiraceae bacterium]|nr:hypothetical protein [Lachnospiraceae bacterium]
MSTEITNNYVNRTYVEPYRFPYSKDPPAGEAKPAHKVQGFEEKAADATLRTYDTARASHFEEMMRVTDPKAYREYKQIKKTTGSTGNPTESMRFMLGWLEDKAVRDPGMERRFTRQGKALDELKARFANASFGIEGAEKKEGETPSEYSVTLTKEEMHTLAYGTKEEKEALFKQIEESMKAIEEAEKGLAEEEKTFDFGIDTKADGTGRFFAMLNGETVRADSAQSLFRMLFAKEQEDELEEAK